MQLQAKDAELYDANGFTVNQMGSSFAVSLDDFTLRGKPFVRLANGNLPGPGAADSSSRRPTR